MKYLLHALLIISIVSLGGCQMASEEEKTNPAEMEPEDLPDARAFEDEFTRGFLQSTKETRPGYYPFVSGTGAYKMDFPASGIIGEKGYGKDADNFEGYLIGIANENGTESSVKIDYLSYIKQGEEEKSLEILNTQFEKELDFKKIEMENKTLYIAPYEDNDGIYGYAGFIQSNLGSGGLQIIYDTECLTSKQRCEKIKKTENENIVKWMESIKFINANKESE